MKLETMKKNNKKKILIGGLITVCLISVVAFTTTRAKYKSTQNLKVASGTVNWKQYDFKVMAMYKSENGTNYSEITTMPGSDYVVNEEKSYCTTNNQTKVKGKIKTVNGIHGIFNLQKSDKCYIWFDKTTETVNTSFGTIVAKLAKPDFSQIATSDEGIYAMADGMYNGTSYFWRGAATTNHVIFADKCWRIVRINGDGSIRLIYKELKLQLENVQQMVLMRQ